MTVQFLVILALVGIKTSDVKEKTKDNHIYLTVQFDKPQMAKFSSALYHDDKDIRDVLNNSLQSITSEDNSNYKLTFRFKDFFKD